MRLHALTAEHPLYARSHTAERKCAIVARNHSSGGEAADMPTRREYKSALTEANNHGFVGEACRRVPAESAVYGLKRISRRRL